MKKKQYGKAYSTSKKKKAEVIALCHKVEPKLSHRKIGKMIGVPKSTVHFIEKQYELQETRGGNELLPEHRITDGEVEAATERMKNKVNEAGELFLDLTITEGEKKKVDHVAAKNFATVAAIMIDKKVIFEGKPQIEEEYLFRSKTRRDKQGAEERIEELIVKAKVKHNATIPEIPES